MPKTDRESISSVKPSGWQNERYDFVPGGWVYNRCHLIGYQLTGENANERNLITGTRYMNTEGMLPFDQAEENLTRRYKRVESMERIARIKQLRAQKKTIAEIKTLLKQEGNG